MRESGSFQNNNPSKPKDPTILLLRFVGFSNRRNSPSCLPAIPYDGQTQGSAPTAVVFGGQPHNFFKLFLVVSENIIIFADETIF